MSVNNPSTAKRGNIGALVIGVLLIGFWVIASLLQIQTSEAFILRGSMVGITPNYNVLMQPIQLFQGQLSSDMGKAALWGWGIELIYLTCVFGYEAAHDSVKSSNRHLASWFKTGAIVLIGFDAWTDFQYGQLASGFWGQVGFAAITAFIVAFFLVAGLRLLEMAFH